MPHTELKIVARQHACPINREITCFAGKVSVFRGPPPSLQVCRDALVNGPAEGAAAVLLDGQPFAAAEHCFVGFADGPLDGTVTDYLVSCGFPAPTALRLLAENDLRALAQRPCSSLSADDDRMVRLLGAVAQKDKVLVLHDPFAPLSEARREQFALRICNAATQAGRIVIVTELSERPEYWIENAAISRIEVSSKRSRTIGGIAGAETDEMRQLLEKVRAEVRNEAKKGGAGGPSRRRQNILAGALMVVLVLLVVQEYQLSRGDPTFSGFEGGRGSRHHHGQAVTSQNSGEQPGSSPSAEDGSPPQASPANDKEKGAYPGADMALARYPAAVQNSIQRAFLGTDVQDLIASSASLSAPAKPAPAENKQPEEIHLLQAAGGDEAPAEPIETPMSDAQVTVIDQNGQPQMVVPPWEQRREQMRQQFLSALTHVD